MGLLLGVWSCSSAAWADPMALRAPAGSVVVVVGLPESSVAAALTPHLGVAVEVHPFSAVGAAVGLRGDLFRGERAFGLELSAAGGLDLPLVDPGLAVSLTPAAELGWAGGSVDATLGLVVPAVVRVAPGADLRLPVLGELWLGGKVGALRLGGTFAAGQLWMAGAPTEFGWHAGLFAALGERRTSPPKCQFGCGRSSNGMINP